ncbi:unnamed protein product [Rotaria socialis]|uniref:Uncharacterized protein n=1 Tax=Rotaria socialis TaxID=392032 RepID=A0A817MIC6_9BILA|nr:unnamed protein product [Rotaria socialis]CAF3635828.1 unnamed protein product [Rotaria socialis]CAF3663673.1 unnamed protein product [Rotaria socialis]CAF4548550.1 unnamed protein product [Rotaria socialis]CAF4896706.1 unnamed protein product [Rotaria socialis]
MAIDSITSYEAQIDRLNQSIQGREQLFDENRLNDQQIKELVDDVGQRWLINKILQQLRQEQVQRHQAAQ